MLRLTRVFAALLIAKVTYGEYAIMYDAGSSGTRAHIFEWQSSADMGVPEVHEVNQTRVRPGLSALTPGEEIEEYLDDLLQFCKSVIPESQHSRTPMYLKATAGMRLLSLRQTTPIMNNVREIFEKSVFDFKSAKIISGGEEGTFGWLTANYLLGTFDIAQGEEPKPSVGALDLGGASTQLSFVPSTDILADYFPVYLGLAEQIQYDLYTHSFLQYGQDQMRMRYNQHVIFNGTAESAACYHDGAEFNYTSGDATTLIRGSGDFAACREVLNSLMFRESTPCFFVENECSINGVYTPEIPPNMTFVAVSAYYYAATGVGFEGGKLSDFVGATDTWCDLPWSEVQQRPGFNPFTINTCFGASLALTYLLDSFDFDPELDGQVRFLDDIEDVDAGWPLGATIYELHIIQIGLGAELDDACSDEAPTLSNTAIAVIASLAVLAGVFGFALLYLCCKAKPAENMLDQSPLLSANRIQHQRV